MLPGPPRLGTDPKWELRDALTVICLLVLHPDCSIDTNVSEFHGWSKSRKQDEESNVKSAAVHQAS